MSLTVSGRKIFTKLLAKSEPLRVRLLTALRPGEATALVELLHRVVEAMAPPPSNGGRDLGH